MDVFLVCFNIVAVVEPTWFPDDCSRTTIIFPTYPYKLCFLFCKLLPRVAFGPFKWWTSLLKEKSFPLSCLNKRETIIDNVFESLQGFFLWLVLIWELVPGMFYSIFFFISFPFLSSTLFFSNHFSFLIFSFYL